MKDLKLSSSPARRIARFLLVLWPGFLAVAWVVSSEAQAYDETKVQESFAATQTLGRGFDADKRFELDALDAVNTFNGNLTLRLPLGPTYQADGGQQYGFALRYNSKAWDFESIIDPAGAETPPPDCPGNMLETALPMRDANVGLGWKISFGELYPPRVRRHDWDGETPHPNPNKSEISWLYVGADGSQVQFIAKIHPAATADHGGGVQVYYSDDGSFRRLRVHDQDGWAALDSPDGATRWFERHCASCNVGAGSWRIRRIFDAADDEPSGALAAQQCVDPANQEGNVFFDYAFGGMQVCDNLGRQHQVVLNAAFQVSEVVLEGFAETELHFRFNYTSRRVAVPLGHSAPPEDSTTEYTLPLLTELQLPAPSSGDADPSRRFSFDYFHKDSPDAPDEHGPTDVRPAGYLTGMSLPTGGAYHYTYQVYAFPNPSDGPSPLQGTNRCLGPSTSVNSSAGIRTRTLEEAFTDFAAESQAVVDGSAQPKRATWTYLPVAPRRTDFASCTAFYPEAQRIVLRPEGDLSVHHYNTFNGCPLSFSSGEHMYESHFGLPYSPLRWTDGGDGQPLFLSQQTFAACDEIPEHYNPADIETTESSGGYTLHPLPETLCPSALVRSTYLRYQLFNEPDAGAWPEDCHDSPATCQAFRQMSSQATVHADGRRTENHRQQWDGLGHFRQAITEGWAATGSQLRSETRHTAYAVGDAGTVTKTRPPAGYPSAGARWLLDLVSGETLSRDGGSVHRSYCHDAAGRVVGRRAHASGAQDSDQDLLARYAYDASGNLESERFYGGDVQGLGGVGGCSQPAFAAEFRQDHAWQSGVRAASFVVDDLCAGDGDRAGCVLLAPYDNTDIDPSTGLVTAMRDASGLQVTADYDALGRLLEITEPGSSPRTITYAEADPAFSIHAETRVSQGDVATRTRFSGLGRPFSTLTTMPRAGGSIESEVRAIYQSDGVVAGRSTPVPAGTTAQYWHSYEYDALGRLTKHRRPDWLEGPAGGSRNDLFYLYQGMNLTAEKSYVKSNLADVGTTGGKMSLATRHTYRDFRDRVAKVVEDLDGDGVPESETLYDYHVTGQLAKVTQGVQQRHFTYDGRGFLLEERHPEKRASGGMVSTSYSYDSMGHARAAETRELGGGLLRWLSFHYDKIGRLTLVWDEIEERPLKELSYYGSGTGRAGKLATSRRHNWLSDPSATTPPFIRDVVATHTYEYSPADGRLSRRHTRTSDGGRFELELSYDDLGRLERIGYPHCPDRSECQPASFRRDVTLSYRHGLLETVSSDLFQGGAFLPARQLAAFGYHADGSLATITAAETLWSQEADFWGLGRPRSIKVEDAAGAMLFDSGTYRYDGAGNVYTIGGDSFAYDPAGRLAEAVLQPQDGGSAAAQSFDYDRHGNLTSIRTDHGADGSVEDLLSLPVDASSNRLTGLHYSYDAFGNMLSGVGGLNLVFDALDAVSESTSTGVNRRYVYDADGERLAVQDLLSGSTTWTLRGVDNKVLRTFEQSRTPTSIKWQWRKDHVHRGATVLAAITPASGSQADDQLHILHVDHLGTPRVITDGSEDVAQRKYFPFGGEMTSSSFDEVLQFTGHERDANADSPGGSARSDDLDYMHARYYTPELGRFLSVDPVKSGRTVLPQAWNLYAYSINNPLAFFDPNGECAVPAGLGKGQVGLCIEAFIGAERINGLGLGDGRSFVANDPEATSRISYKVIIEPATGRAVSQQLESGTSHIGLTHESAFGLPGSSNVQGVSRFTEGRGTDMEMYFTGTNGVTMMRELGIPAPDLGVIEFVVGLSIDTQGAVTVDPSSSSKGFPSIEGYAYRLVDGQLEIQTLFAVQEQQPRMLKEGLTVPLVGQPQQP